MLVEPGSGDITLLLQQAASGDSRATERLADAVYAELRRIAGALMARERRDHTLQPTVIAGEAYLNLVEQRDRNWQNRAHFFAVAAQAMRRLLVDYGRRRQTQKRGAGAVGHVDVDPPAADSARPFEELLAVNEVLDRLGAIDPRQARIVELRYFGGLTEEETAEVLKISTRTVKRDWTVARAWLYAELTRRAGDSPGAPHVEN
jgi:RNA polymerase sigma factor (TIGR02999 family)